MKLFNLVVLNSFLKGFVVR